MRTGRTSGPAITFALFQYHLRPQHQTLSPYTHAQCKIITNTRYSLGLVTALPDPLQRKARGAYPQTVSIDAAYLIRCCLPCMLFVLFRLLLENVFISLFHLFAVFGGVVNAIRIFREKRRRSTSAESLRWTRRNEVTPPSLPSPSFKSELIPICF